MHYSARIDDKTEQDIPNLTSPSLLLLLRQSFLYIGVEGRLSLKQQLINPAKWRSTRWEQNRIIIIIRVFT